MNACINTNDINSPFSDDINFLLIFESTARKYFDPVHVSSLTTTNIPESDITTITTITEKNYIATTCTEILQNLTRISNIFEIIPTATSELKKITKLSKSFSHEQKQLDILSAMNGECPSKNDDFWCQIKCITCNPTFEQCEYKSHFKIWERLAHSFSEIAGILAECFKID